MMSLIALSRHEHSDADAPAIMAGKARKCVLATFGRCRQDLLRCVHAELRPQQREKFEHLSLTFPSVMV